MRCQFSIVTRFLFMLSILLGCNKPKSQPVSSPGTQVFEIVVAEGEIVKDRFNPPEGFVRLETDSGSYASYLQNFPLKPNGSRVTLYNGAVKPNQEVHAAVLDIDVGSRDLQQCADAVMRLRAEYLYQERQYEDIAFNFVSDGKPRYFLTHTGADTTRIAFRKYMNYVFSYANTRSLKHQMEPVKYSGLQIGDVFIQSGNPYGHAVIIMDMARNDKGEAVYLIAQSYMPAQDIHILINPVNRDLSPWYKLDTSESVVFTPEWKFLTSDLRRF